VIVVDASIWIDHFRRADPRLSEAMTQKQTLMHPFVIGEIALGSIGQRQSVILMLRGQHKAPVATHDEVLDLIERERLYGLGIGYVDAHLLASARLANATLWTHDKRLDLAADRLGIRADVERRH
jgi:predicted nucleic acid-binding protein